MFNSHCFLASSCLIVTFFSGRYDARRRPLLSNVFHSGTPSFTFIIQQQGIPQKHENSSPSISLHLSCFSFFPPLQHFSDREFVPTCAMTANSSCFYVRASSSSSFLHLQLAFIYSSSHFIFSFKALK